MFVDYIKGFNYFLQPGTLSAARETQQDISSELNSESGYGSHVRKRNLNTMA